MLERKLRKPILKDLFKGKAIILVGARQVGKTTLVREIQAELQDKHAIKYLNLDNPGDLAGLTDVNFEDLDRLFAKTDIIIIDEAQRLQSIGLVIKLLVDNYKNEKQVIATGSSSINLLDFTNEPLTGRKFTYHMFPLSLDELYHDTHELEKGFKSNIIFGFYPEISKEQTKDDKIRLLRELSTSYLYKDIFEFQDIRNPEVLGKLLQLLALQIGSEVSYSELASQLGLDYKTVERYIDLLEKAFVVFRLSAYSTNKRREISKNRKVYFYDLGVRNTIIDNFNQLDLRTDLGQLWENFLVVERMKYREYNNIYAKQYFWRTYDSGEIDLVEDRETKLFGYEFKWKKATGSAPKTWQDYPNAEYKLINKDNFSDIVFG
ncbi:MAG: ATP-binding protein [Paludibacteraceae bacterium]|nr:ATP-binding protein [Paludibacteraceae bacterium]